MSADDTPEQEPPEEEAPEVIAAKEAFAPFLAANPLSSIIADDGDDGRLKIVGLWGEGVININIPDNPEPLTKVLNNLVLPESFTAIWHMDRGDLEVIWTAFTLPTDIQELMERKFVFSFEGKEYQCEFDQSSDRLLAIAKHVSFAGISRTDYRNLFSFNVYMKREENERKYIPLGSRVSEPKSFWIRQMKLTWDEEYTLRLVRRLNFYLRYYDDQSPTIAVHSSLPEKAHPRTRYIIGEFPNRIDSQEIDEELLQLWAASSSEGAPAQRFIYLYRIVEYVSHTYVEEGVRNQVKKLLSTPHALSNVNTLTNDIVSASLAASADEYQKTERLMRDAIDPSLLWIEISKNLSVFNQRTMFNGGLVLDPLVRLNCREEDFTATDITNFHKLTRQIRNHLSHGRDKSTLASITPTRENFLKLEPWVSALSVAVGEIINYRHVR